MTMKTFAANQSSWGYLMGSVSSEQGLEREGSMAAYYMANGTPPGIWAGSGLSGVSISSGQAVNVDALSAIYGSGLHPVTGEPLGHKFREVLSLDERVAARIATEAIDPDETVEQLAERAASIFQEEKDRQVKQSVAGFEFVFSPPKSVSSWWAIADPDLKDQIRKAHHDAIKATIDMMEKDIVRTRIGESGVAQAKVQGIMAALFDHWDTREGDPQLHTHMLVSNKVQTADGKWRTIDSRTLFYAVNTASEHYDAVLMDQLSAQLGVEWTTQSVLENPQKYLEWRTANQLSDSPASRHQFALDSGVSVGSVKWQLQDVPHTLNKAFSNRAAQISEAKDKLINEYLEKHGSMPTDRTIIKMRQAVTLSTRRAKRVLSLRNLTASWRNRAQPIVGDTFLAADRIRDKGKARLTQYPLWSFRKDDITSRDVDAVVQFALGALKDSSTWRRSNAEAAVLRATAGWRFRSVEDRREATKAITESVIAAAIPLTPKNHLRTPFVFQTPDGATVFQPKAHDLFTSVEVWDAEERILVAGRSTDSAAVNVETVEALISTPTGEEGRILSPDQAAAVSNLLTSGRLLDVLVGPAGSGKTTSLEKLREIWETQHGEGSVRGLAPTARAAEVLAESLGIETENTAKWIHETTRGTTEKDGFNYSLNQGDLLIVDEASIAGTIALDTLREQASVAGAKVLLVGDWAQLAAVDAGGAFGLLAGDRTDVAELTALHRFKSEWEAEASKLLRLGRASAINAYEENGRIETGLDETVIDKAVEAWKEDETKLTDNGEQYVSLLIAPTNDMVERLNTIARQWRIEQGHVDTSKETQTASGTVSIGDRIVTRQNARTLRTDKDRWVKNNDEWVVAGITKSGAIIAKSGKEKVVLPADYAVEHVQLAYATTAHRSQGRTVDTAHTIVDSSASRETFYVAMTRGKHSNKAYVIEDEEGLLGNPGALGMSKTWRETLEAVLNNRGGGLAAHDTLRQEAERIGSTRQLVAEYQTIISAALQKEFVPMLTELGVLDAEAPDSAYLGPVLANLRRLALHDKDIPETVQAALDSRGLDDARDPLAVLHYRLEYQLEDIQEIKHHEEKYAPLLNIFSLELYAAQDRTKLTLYRALDTLQKQPTSKELETIVREVLEKVDRTAGDETASKSIAFALLAKSGVDIRELKKPGDLPPTTTGYIAGIVEPAPSIKDAETMEALEDRALAIQLRAEMILDEAIKNNEPWLKELGKPIVGEESEWRKRAVTVACYRDLYGVETDHSIDNKHSQDRNRRKARDIARMQIEQPNSAATRGTREQLHQQLPGSQKLNY